METQTQNQEVVTRSELNYLRAADAMKTLNSKLENENAELKKSLADKDHQINSHQVTITNQQSDLHKLRRELEGKNEIINENKYDLIELRTHANRVGELERSLFTLTKKHENELDVKNYTIKSKDKEIESLNETIASLEEELQEYENEDTDEEEETEELEDGGELLLEDGGIIGEGLEQYEMPEDYVQKKKDAILKLIDGGNISMKQIEALQQAKLNLGGELTAKTEREQTEKAILDGIKKGNGRIPESELIKIKGVTLNDGGLVVLAKGGELNLRRSFLHPSFVLIPKKP